MTTSKVTRMGSVAASVALVSVLSGCGAGGIGAGATSGSVGPTTTISRTVAPNSTASSGALATNACSLLTRTVAKRLIPSVTRDSSYVGDYPAIQGTGVPATSNCGYDANTQSNAQYLVELFVILAPTANERQQAYSIARKALLNSAQANAQNINGETTTAKFPLHSVPAYGPFGKATFEAVGGGTGLTNGAIVWVAGNQLFQLLVEGYSGSAPALTSLATLLAHQMVRNV
jgi:hypothetical protein